MILMLTITGCTANSSRSSDDDNEQLSMQVGFDADEYYERLESCVAQIREKTDFVPDIALVLGSGLGDYADSANVSIAAEIPYSDIDGFPVSTVAGHDGKLIFCEIEGKTVALDNSDGYLLVPCDQPIAVIEGDTALKLGTEETNGLLFAVAFENNSVFFNFAHNFCGACGAMRWIKATLWQYLTDLGYAVDKKGIMTIDTPITDEKQAVPDVGSLPVGEPLGNFDFARDSFMPMNDYIARMRDPNGIDVDTRRFRHSLSELFSDSFFLCCHGASPVQSTNIMR